MNCEFFNIYFYKNRKIFNDKNVLLNIINIKTVTKNITIILFDINLFEIIAIHLK
ncbi:hypothetical protein NUSPORA_02581 [Nucleospora cyclopteri]